MKPPTSTHFALLALLVPSLSPSSTGRACKQHTQASKPSNRSLKQQQNLPRQSTQAHPRLNSQRVPKLCRPNPANAITACDCFLKSRATSPQSSIVHASKELQPEAAAAKIFRGGSRIRSWKTQGGMWLGAVSRAVPDICHQPPPASEAPSHSNRTAAGARPFPARSRCAARLPRS